MFQMCDQVVNGKLSLCRRGIFTLGRGDTLRWERNGYFWSEGAFSRGILDSQRALNDVSITLEGAFFSFPSFSFAFYAVVSVGGARWRELTLQRNLRLCPCVFWRFLAWL